MKFFVNVKYGFWGWLLYVGLIVLWDGASLAQAQIHFRQENLLSTRVNRSSDVVEGKSSIAIQDRGGQIKMPFAVYDWVWKVSYARFTKTLTYRGFDEPTSSTSDFTLQREDLPKNLYLTSQGLEAIVPSPRGHGYLIGGGVIRASDEKDLSALDYGRYGQFLYVSSLKGSSWLFGVVQTMVFGEPRVYPVIGYNEDEGGKVKISFTLPGSLILEVPLKEEISLVLEGEVDGASYRLTKRDPWNHAILSFSNIKTSASLYYDLGGLKYFFGIGHVTHRRTQFHDKEDDLLGEIFLKDTIAYSVGIGLF